MRKLFILGILSLLFTGLNAQIIPIKNGTINVCEGTFTDSGKDTGNYGPNENYTLTICPGTQGGNVRLKFSQVILEPGDDLCFYDGTSNNEPLLACTSNFSTGQFTVQATNATGCLTAVFISNAYQEAKGWEAEISCAPICQPIVAQLVSTAPSIQNNYIDICTEGQVTLNATALFPNNNQSYQQDIADCTFEWEFGDGQTATGQSVTHTFAQAGGAPVKLTITDQYGCKSQNNINANIRVAAPPQLKPATTALEVCPNKLINLSASATDADADIFIEQEKESFSNIKSHSDSLALPDGTGASYVSTLTYDEFAPNQTIQNASDLKRIFVNMEHSWMRDLEISIECPSGKKVVLDHHPGNTGGEVFLGEPNELDEALATPIPGVGYDYGWTSDATRPNWIDYANQFHPATLPAGDYQPYESFTQLTGCPLNGDWRIEVKDLWASDNGFIFAWGLEFDESLYPQGEEFQPEITGIQWQDNAFIINNNGDDIDFLSSLAGKTNLNVTVSNDFGCTVDTQITVHVLPPTSPQCYECSDFKTSLPDTAVCAGQELEFDAHFDKSAIESIGFQSTENQSFSGDLSSILTVTAINPGAIDNVNYRVDSIYLTIGASQPATVDCYLTTPSGKKLTIGENIHFSGNGQLTLVPGATLTASNASTPFGASYLPADGFSPLQSEPTNGDWTLTVHTKNNVSVTLVNWGLRFKNNVSIGYHWTGAGLSCTDCPNPQITPTAAGQYIVEVYDNLGCAYADTAQIEIIQALPAPVINEPQYDNGQVVFTWNPVPNASGYLIKINNSNWITPNGNLSQTVSGYVMGDEINFQVKALAAGGCDGSDANLQLKITDCLLTGAYSVTQAPKCTGIADGAISLSANNGTPPFEYALDGGTFSATTDYNNLASGTHFAIYRDAAGCYDTLVFDLNPLKNLDLTIVPTNVTCNGNMDGTATATVTGATAPLQYNWQSLPGQNVPAISNLGPGMYNLTVTDADGCQVQGSASITEPAALNLSFENVKNISCNGSADGSIDAVVQGGTSPYAFAWSSGETTTGISGKPAGSYSLTVTDASGCSVTGNITLTEPNSPVTVSAVQTVQGCAYLNSSKAVANASGGVAPYSYQWSNGQNNAIANNLPPGNYTVTATDANGCQASTSLPVSDLEPVEVTLAFTEPTCHGGNNATVEVTAIQGGNSSNLADYTYLWLNQPDTDYKLENVAGDKSYYVTVTGTSGCQGTAGILVTDPDAMEVSLTSTPVTCNGDQNGTAKVLQVTGGTAPFSYQWDAKAGNATTGEVTNLSGDLYAVTVTDANGCTGTNDVLVTEAEPLTLIKKESRDPRCAGNMDGVVTLLVGGGVAPYNYQWSNGGTSNVIGALSGGSYVVTISDQYGCQIIDSTQLTEPAPVIATTVAQEPTCNGEANGTLTINVNGGIPPYEYSLNNNSFVSNNVFEEVGAGVYPVFVRDTNGCMYIDTVTVSEPPLFSVDAGPDLHLSYGEVIQVDIEAENAFGEISLMTINPLAEVTECTGCFEIEIDPRYHGTYQIVATDERGCVATDEIEIQIDRNEELYVPTAFTPNGDGVNDFLTCHSKTEATVSYFRVYDRWGELLYEQETGKTNQMNEGWDGTFRGKKMPAGTYIWTAHVRFDTGKTAAFKGQTNLIR